MGNVVRVVDLHLPLPRGKDTYARTKAADLAAQHIRRRRFSAVGAGELSILLVQL
jgi:hypothetical protein